MSAEHYYSSGGDIARTAAERGDCLGTVCLVLAGDDHVVRGHGLVLRAYRESDIDALRVHFADPEGAKWNTWPADLDLNAWWRERNDWSDGTRASWAVAAESDESRLLGTASLHHINIDQRDAEIGYTVQPDARRRGVASAAVRVATDFAFGRLDLHRIQLLHSTGNVASCGVALATGFRLEGELRESYRYADGVFQDEHLHARLNTD